MTLDGEILEELTRPLRQALRSLSRRLGVSMADVVAACERLEQASHVYVFKEGTTLYACIRSRIDDAGLRVCPICRTVFDRYFYDAEQTRKRVPRNRTCSKSCAVALSWRNPEARAARCKSITAIKRTAENAEHQRQLNYQRWARPGEREKLSERNRRMWADPASKIERSVAISKRHSEPRARAAQAERISKRWRDPEARQKLVDGIRISKRSPESRAKFSAIVRQRWKDPEYRRKWTAANAKKNTPERRAAAAEKIRERWKDPEQRQKMSAGIRAAAQRRREKKA